MRNTTTCAALFSLVLSLLFTLPPCTAVARGSSLDGSPPGILELIDPPQNAIVVGKRPVIRFRLPGLENVEGYLAILDGTDITALLQQEQDVFTYRPIAPLPSGDHVLRVFVQGADGIQVGAQKQFRSRHSEAIEEAYSENNVGAVYRSVLYRRGSFEDESNYEATGNLSTASRIKESALEATAEANVWYQEQNQPIADPQQPGLNLADFRLTTSYTQDRMKAYTEIGDIPIELTPYLIQGLPRRGGAAGIEYGDSFFRAMNTSSRDLFGFNGGLGMGDTSDDSITALAAGADLFSGRMNVKAAYLTGGEEKDAYNSWRVDSVEREGDAVGLLLQTNLFHQRLQLETEVAHSNYDFNTADEFSGESGQAYRLSAGGVYEQFSYGATYQRISPDYEIIAAPGTPNDREELRVNGGVTLERDAVQISLAQYHDNVDNDDLFPRVTYTDGSIDYFLGRFGDLTASFGYMKNLQKSSREPDDLVDVDATTDTVTASLGYTKDYYSVGVSGTCSELNDRTDTDADSRILSFGITPAYYWDWVSAAAGLNWTRFTDETTHVDTDTFNFSLSLNGDIVRNRFSYDVAGTYTTNEASDDSLDTTFLDTIARLTYNVADDFMGFANPSVGLEGRFFRSHDHLTGDTENDTIISLVFSTSYHFGF